MATKVATREKASAQVELKVISCAGINEVLAGRPAKTQIYLRSLMPNEQLYHLIRLRFLLECSLIDNQCCAVYRLELMHMG